MRNALRRVARRRTNLLAGLAAVTAASLAMPSLATAAETDSFGFAGSVTVPGNPLVSFDISWVSGEINEYLLADRSNFSIDAIPMQASPPVFQIVPTGANAFAGAAGGNNNLAGPNGIVVFNDATSAAGLQLFVGDGPSTNPVCGGGTCSTVKVFTAVGLPNPSHTVNTGGVMRADELCFAPANSFGNSFGFGPRNHGEVMIANDADTPPFVTFIPTSGSGSYSVVKRITFGTATNGIEQCAYDPGTDFIYLNIPEVSGPGNDTSPGAIVVLDPTSMTVIAAFGINIEACAGPQGMALGTRTSRTFPAASDNQILLGCNAPSVGGPFAGQQNTIVTSPLAPGAIVKFLENLGGDDEVYHNDLVQNLGAGIAGTGHWYLAGGSFVPTEQLAIIDPLVPLPTEIDNVIPTGFPGGTTRRTHSVASWAGVAPGAGSLEAAILPVPATGGGSPGFMSTVCNTPASGCIAFWLISPIPSATEETHPE
jgi:hypothetical protein